MATPEVANQPRPTVRIAPHAPGVSDDRGLLSAIRAGRADLVYRGARQTRIVELGLHRLLCRLPVGAIRDASYCPSDRSVIHDRTFSYGWQVHRLVQPATAVLRLGHDG